MSLGVEYIGYFKASNLSALTKILTEIKKMGNNYFSVHWNQESCDVVEFKVSATSEGEEEVWQKLFLVYRQIVNQADEYLIIIFNDYEKADFPMISNILGKRIHGTIPFSKYFKELRNCGNDSYSLINLFVKQLKKTQN